MKIIIAGGTGYLGQLLIKHFLKTSRNRVVVLSRNHRLDTENLSYVKWDGKTLGHWAQHLENADVLINLAGKSVNCRYTSRNKAEIYNSRLDSTFILCKTIQHLKYPPNVFIQSSSATIYRHSEDKLMTETNGEIGIDFSMDVCKKWEALFNSFQLPHTKKIITRTSIVMGNSGGAFPIIKRLTQFGLGGKQGNGNQYISWISENDYIECIAHLMHQNEGAYNLCSPNPLRNKEFQKLLRQQLQIKIGIPTPRFLLNIGAFFIQTEPELILKSRKVYPEKLVNTGFKFNTERMEAFLKTI